MKPKTVIQKTAFSLHKKLGMLTIKQRNKCLDFCKPVAIAHKGHVKCCECGGEYEMDLNGEKAITCPVCGKSLEVSYSRAKNWSKRYFAMISQEYHGWQVFRYVYVEKSVKHNIYSGKPIFFVYEPMQMWLNENGDRVFVSMPLKAYPYRCFNPFKLDGEMTIKTPPKYYGGYDISNLSYSYIDIESVAKFLKYRGFTRVHGVNKVKGEWFDELCAVVVKNPIYELMYKRNLVYLIRFCEKERYFVTNKDHYDKRMAAMKIALKHHYFDRKELRKTEKDGYREIYPALNNWRDLVDSLIYLGKDYRSPHYVCPDDLDKMHDTMVFKMNKVKNAETRRTKYLSALEKEGVYIESRKKFFDLVIHDDLIQIQVLRNIKQFMDEGDRMHHCVFSMSYYDVNQRPDTLILSARIGDNWFKPEKYLETIEVNLSDYSISQCHGLQNQDSPYHKRIMRLVRQNMDKIMECNKRKVA